MRYQKKLILPKKKTTVIFTTNTNNSQLFVSLESIKKLLKGLKDDSYNIYLAKLNKYKDAQELKELKYEMNLLKKKKN